MIMVALELFSIISHAQDIRHSRAFHMMLTKCRSPNTTKGSSISTTSPSSIGMPGQHSYLISQTVLHDQALSVSMNQSRTYCWAILGSQSQIKSDILGVGSAFDAQKQFLANTEDAIQSPVDLPSQITRYQNALKYARTKVDYVFGFGLYMAPSNMELRIGTIQGYNNKIILSTHDQKLWWNATVNLSADATSYSGNVSGTTTKKSTPEVPTVLSKPQKPNTPTAVQGKTVIGAWGMPITIPNKKQADEIYKKRIEQYHKIKDTYGPTITPDPHQMSLIPKTVSSPSSKSGTHKKIKHDPATHKSDPISGTHKSADQPTLGVQSTETHENNKTALILGSIIVGSVALIIYEIY